MKRAAAIVLLALAACRPPASDEYVERVPLDRTQGDSRAPIASPDVEGAIWAPSGGPGRLVYGKPGQAPLFIVECAAGGPAAALRMTRVALADPQAKALMALIGNGHIARLKVDAENNGSAWLWEGRYDPADPRLDVLTGPRAVEVTVPGAGTLKLNPSPLPGALVERCRRLGDPAGPVEAQPRGEPLPPA